MIEDSHTILNLKVHLFFGTKGGFRLSLPQHQISWQPWWADMVHKSLNIFEEPKKFPQCPQTLSWRALRSCSGTHMWIVPVLHFLAGSILVKGNPRSAHKEMWNVTILCVAEVWEMTMSNWKRQWVDFLRLTSLFKTHLEPLKVDWAVAL